MLTLLLLTWLQAAPAQPAPPPAQPAPPSPQTAKPRAAAPAAGTTLTLTVTDTVGAVLEGVTVTLVGAADREDKTTAEGRVRLLNIPAGTHRVRFAREGFHTFEKELVWRAGQPAPSMTVTLTSAPPPPAPPEPPPPPTPQPQTQTPTPQASLPPPGDPKTMGLLDYIERNFISNREPQKESIVGCSGVGQSIVWQIREPWEGRSHPTADAMLYVVGGEGTLDLDGRETNIGAGSFAVVPRGSGYDLSRRGRNPLIILAFLAGAPCAAN